MNEHKPDLFARYDPLKKGPYLLRVEPEDRLIGVITIRPVWIIGDLRVLNEWFSSPLKKTNWNLNLGKTAIMQHYKQLLLSNDCQSFMIEQDNLPVVQVDVLPVNRSNFRKQIDCLNNDYVINYLFKDSFRDPNLFDKCLLSSIKYLFSYSATGNLYLRLPKAEHVLQEQLLQIGFEIIDSNNLFGRSLNIYRISRSRYNF